MTTLQHEHDQFLEYIKPRILNPDTTVDSAVYDIRNFILDLIQGDGGDDDLAHLPAVRTAHAMVALLTNADIDIWDEIEDEESEEAIAFYQMLKARFLDNPQKYNKALCLTKKP